MNWNKWIRQIHRWLSIIFTAIVAAIFIALGVGREPAEWVYLMPLFPLALLLLTGLYMFVLPYAPRWNSGQSRGGSSRRDDRWGMGKPGHRGFRPVEIHRRHSGLSVPG